MKKLLFIFGFLVVVLARYIFSFNFPPSLNWDEVSLGYNAYSLVYTGADEWGVAFPSIFRAYGDYKLPIYIYSLAPVVLTFGLNFFTVRIVSFVAGLISIVLVYLLIRRLLPSRISTAIVSGLSFALVPWSWFLGHIALEANLGLLMILCGLVCLVYRRFSSGLIMFGLSLWTYNANRIFVPLFLLATLIIYRPKIINNLKNILIFSAFFIPVVVQLASPSGQARFKWTTILDSGAIAQINDLRSSPGGRLVYNKVTYFAFHFSKNYLAHFNPVYLFVSGGSQYQFNVPDTGLLFLIQLPLVYVGFVLSLRSKSRYRYLLLLWLILAPIPASITRDAPHVLRSLPLLVIYIIYLAYAYDYIYRKIHFIMPVYFVLLVLSFSFYLSKLPSYEKSYSWSWQYGYNQLVDQIMSQYSQYDEFIITKRYGEPHEFFLFYSQWDPYLYRNDSNLVRYGQSDWFWVDKFAKFRFVNDWEMPSTVANLPAGKKYFIVSSPDNPTIGSGLGEIKFLDGSSAFHLKIL